MKIARADGRMGQRQQTAFPGGVTCRPAAEWGNRIDLIPLLTDSEGLKMLVIIYRPAYRQTLYHDTRLDAGRVTEGAGLL